MCPLTSSCLEFKSVSLVLKGGSFQTCFLPSDSCFLQYKPCAYKYGIYDKDFDEVLRIFMNSSQSENGFLSHMREHKFLSKYSLQAKSMNILEMGCSA